MQRYPNLLFPCTPHSHTRSFLPTFHLGKMFFCDFSGFDFLPFLSLHDCFYVVLEFVRVIPCSPGLLPSFRGFGMILSIDLSRSWSHTSPYLASPLFSFRCLLRSIFPSGLLLILAAFCSCSCFLVSLFLLLASLPIHFRLLSSLTSSPAFLFILLPRLLFFSSLLKTRLN